ncbi:MAG: hypothetical protein DHS20C10_11460 [marine bacterium B5-7]|nr:MAG: hypothetical protein DHS20C10_11460 [marine bacterium B5-7]
MIDALEDRLAGRFLFPIFSQCKDTWLSVHGTKWGFFKLFLLFTLLFSALGFAIVKIWPVDINHLAQTIGQLSLWHHILFDVIAALLIAPLSVGMIVFSLALLKKEKISVFHIFKPYQAIVTVGLTAVIAVLIKDAAVLAFTYASLHGLAMLAPAPQQAPSSLYIAVAQVIPYITTAILTYISLTIGWFAPLLAYRQGLQPWAAIKTSFNIVRHRWIRCFFFFLLISLFAGLLCATLIGFLWGFPLMMLSFATAYQTFFGEAA